MVNFLKIALFPLWKVSLYLLVGYLLFIAPLRANFAYAGDILHTNAQDNSQEIFAFSSLPGIHSDIGVRLYIDATTTFRSAELRIYDTSDPCGWDIEYVQILVVQRDTIFDDFSTWTQAQQFFAYPVATTTAGECSMQIRVASFSPTEITLSQGYWDIWFYILPTNARYVGGVVLPQWHYVGANNSNIKSFYRGYYVWGYMANNFAPYFKLMQSETFPEASIEILQPQNGQTFIENEVVLETRATSSFPGEWWVRFKVLSANTLIWTTRFAELTNPPDMASYFATMTTLANGDYVFVSQVERFANNGIDILASANVSFNVSMDNNPLGKLLSPPTSTSTDLVITCDSQNSAFNQSMCYLGQFLFQPSPAAVMSIYEAKDELMKKPPFGYVPAIYKAATYNENIEPAWTTQNEVKDFFNGLAYIKSGITILLGLSFFVFLLKRLRSFDL